MKSLQNVSEIVGVLQTRDAATIPVCLIIFLSMSPVFPPAPFSLGTAPSCPVRCENVNKYLWKSYFILHLNCK